MLERAQWPVREHGDVLCAAASRKPERALGAEICRIRAGPAERRLPRAPMSSRIRIAWRATIRATSTTIICARESRERAERTPHSGREKFESTVPLRTGPRENISAACQRLGHAITPGGRGLAS